MPFEEVETEGKVTVPTALIGYMRAKARGASAAKVKGGAYNRNSERPRLEITIPTTICGRAKSEKFVIILGKGNDAGKIRIRGSEAPKAVKPTQFKHAMTFRFGYVPKLGDDIAGAERVLVRSVSNEEFELDAPGWFKW